MGLRVVGWYGMNANVLFPAALEINPIKKKTSKTYKDSEHLTAVKLQGCEVASGTNCFCFVFRKNSDPFSQICIEMGTKKSARAP